MERSVLVRRTAPVAVFVAVLGGLIALNARTGGSHPRTAKHLAPIPVAAGFRAEGVGAPRDAAATAPYYWNGEIVIPEALLAGLPTEAPVVAVTTGNPADARITALAKALGVSGDVRRDDNGWVVGSGDRTLRVMSGPGLPWYLGPDKVAVVGGVGIATAAPDRAVEETKPTGDDTAVTNEPAPSCAPAPDDDGNTSSGCADPQPADCPPPPDGAEPACVLPKPPPPPSQPPRPSDAVARAVAQRVFDAVGLTGATITLNDDAWAGTEVVASPVAAGLPTVGFETRVTVTGDGDAGYANGFLGATAVKDTYPLLAPREAVERGGAYGGGPRILGDIAPAAPVACPSGEPCPTPTPREATKLRLGLLFLASYDTQQGAFLTPAWLLSFGGDAWEEPVLALPDAYLATPPPATDLPGKPGVVPPADPGTDPGTVDGGGSTGSGGSAGSTGAPE